MSSAETSRAHQGFCAAVLADRVLSWAFEGLGDKHNSKLKLKQKVRSEGLTSPQTPLAFSAMGRTQNESALMLRLSSCLRSNVV